MCARPHRPNWKSEEGRCICALPDRTSCRYAAGGAPASPESGDAGLSACLPFPPPLPPNFATESLPRSACAASRRCRAAIRCALPGGKTQRSPLGGSMRMRFKAQRPKHQHTLSVHSRRTRKHGKPMAPTQPTDVDLPNRGCNSRFLPAAPQGYSRVTWVPHSKSRTVRGALLRQRGCQALQRAPALSDDLRPAHRRTRHGNGGWLMTRSTTWP